MPRPGPKTKPLPPVPTGRTRRAILSTQQILDRTADVPKAKIGRPLSYSDDLCDRAVALGALGNSWAGIAAAFGVSRKTINEWEQTYPRFSDALHRARAASQAWWEREGRSSLKRKHYQAQVFRTMTAAQFEDYREQRSVAALDALPDLLMAINEVAERRQARLTKADAGADAQPVDVVVEATGREPDQR